MFPFIIIYTSLNIPKNVSWISFLGIVPVFRKILVTNQAEQKQGAITVLCNFDKSKEFLETFERVFEVDRIETPAMKQGDRRNRRRNIKASQRVLLCFVQISRDIA